MKKSFLSGFLSRKAAPPSQGGEDTPIEAADFPFGGGTFGTSLATLIAADPIDALARIAQAFTHLERPELAGDLRVRLLLALDDRGCECIGAIEPGLFVHLAAESASEARRAALLAYYERFGAAALAALGPAPGRPTLVIERSRVVLLVNRALLALAGRQKMLALGQREIPASFWSEVLRLRRIALAQGVERDHCAPYSQLPLTSNAAQVIALLMAFSAAPRHQMRPNQIQALDRLLRTWFEANILDIRDAPGNEQTVYFFGAGMRAPFRALSAMHLPGDGVLYIGLDEAQARATELGVQLRETGVLPPALGPAGAPVQAWMELADTLVNHWSPSPPARQSERRAHAGEMLVAPGFAAATRLIALSAQARAAVAGGYAPGYFAPEFDVEVTDPALAGSSPIDALRRSDALRALQQLEQQEKLPGIVKWQFIDHSATGFALLLTASADWAHPGRVVSYRRENGSIWRMALIRRRTRNANGETVIGLEKLPASPQPAHLMALTRDDRGAWSQPQIALPGLAPAIFFGARPPLLLIERTRFRDGHRHLLVVGGERYLVDLRVGPERDPDFVVARVDFMSAPLQGGASEATLPVAALVVPGDSRPPSTLN